VVALDSSGTVYVTDTGNNRALYRRGKQAHPEIECR
jgi:hypothetical protein